jgi:hypothetical protein
MNSRAVIGIIALLVMLPVLYLVFDQLIPEVPEYSFRGHLITPVHEANGQVTVPTVEEDEKGATLHATFKPAFLEKMSGVKPPNPNGLDITVDGVDDNTRTCTEQGKIPAKASFTVAKNCAAADFAAWKSEKKGALLVDPEQHIIVFGASGNNLVRAYHDDMIATYTSPDMIQSDRKKEACTVRMMLDHLIGKKPEEGANCATAP